MALILLVEDDADIRESLVELLQAEGHVVDTAANGREAVERLERPTAVPGIVLLDLMMPVMNGRDFLAAMKGLGDQAKRALPVVVLTASRERFDDPNVVAWAKKPIDVPALLSLIERHHRQP